MSSDIRERIRDLRTAIRSKQDADKAKSVVQRYSDLKENLVTIKDALKDLRVRSSVLAAEGVEIQPKNLQGVRAALEEQRSRLDTDEIEKFDSSALDKIWGNIAGSWKTELDVAQERAEAGYPGSELSEQVLNTLRRHFPGLIDEVKSLKEQRRKLRAAKPKPNGYLQQLRKLHEAELETLARLAGDGMDESWKKDMQALVGSEGVAWPDLQDSPLMNWLKEHDLLGSCRVWLR